MGFKNVASGNFSTLINTDTFIIIIIIIIKINGIYNAHNHRMFNALCAMQPLYLKPETFSGK